MGAFLMLTRVDWDRLYNEMEGGGACGVGSSAVRACKDLGLKLRDYKGLLRRSDERRVGDEEWVHEVRGLVDGLEEIRGGHLEDEAYKRAFEGSVEEEFDGKGVLRGSKVKKDNRLLERMLSKYNPAFREKRGLDIDQRVTVSVGGEDMRIKLLAMRGMKESELKHIEALEGNFSEVCLNGLGLAGKKEPVKGKDDDDSEMGNEF